VIDPGIVQGFQIAQSLTPLVLGLVQGLIEAGHSPDEAVEIVHRDITSLRSKYEQQKAEDRRALLVKHGVPDELADTEPPALLDPWPGDDS
jgi:hypothetical protein